MGIGCRLDDVCGTVDVRLLHFERIVSSDFDALQSGRMNDDLDSIHRTLQPVAVAHISDEIAHAMSRRRMFGFQFAPQFGLPMFRTRIDHNPLRHGVGYAEKIFGKRRAERAAAPCNQYRLHDALTMGATVAPASRSAMSPLSMESRMMPRVWS